MLFVLKLGYTILMATLLLMAWAIVVKASPIPAPHGVIPIPSMVGSLQESADLMKNPSCAFNPLCTCSKSVHDLGHVLCRDVPLTRLPQALNSSRIYNLRLENNGLRYIEPQLLQATGLYRLHISDNPLPELPEDSLMGLDRSLGELALQRVSLTAVPHRAIRHLQKLKHLDVTGNDICELSSDSFRGLENSLQTLTLADNSLSSLPSGVFTELRMLESLDLSGNVLRSFDAAALPPRLQYLSLADNIFTNLPMAALRTGIRFLDISRNRITRIFPESDDDDDDMQDTSVSPGQPTNMGGGRGTGNMDSGPRLSMDVLRLDYNQISELPEASFRSFGVVNATYLDGNPIMAIHNNAFREAHIRELSLRDCSLSHLPLNAFSGLEKSLHHLDLSSNNLTVLPPGVFGHLQNLQGLFLNENNMNVEPGLLEKAEVGMIATTKSSSGGRGGHLQTHHNLHRLELSGRHMHMPKEMSKLIKPWGSLMVLSLGHLSDKSLGMDDLQDLSPVVEELRIVAAGLQGINANAFRHARSLRRLDLSENSILKLEDAAFADIGHSLQELRMHRAFSTSDLPVRALSSLSNTRYLDLSANGFKKIPDNAFHMLRNLRRVRLHDNHIDRIPKGLFQSEFHSILDEVDFSFNNIDHVHVDTFSGINSLRKIRLDDNRIGSIEPHSFVDLPRLERLELRGNRLGDLNPETFQNLPVLKELDLAYNKLKNLDLAALDQVGSASLLRVNASHNAITELRPKTHMTSTSGGNNDAIVHTPNLYNGDIKIFDLSYNNISDISNNYFKPIENSLMSLHLSHNMLTNASRGAFGNMPHLQWLDLSYNDIRELDSATFRNTKSLQVLYLQHNELQELPEDVLQDLSELRVVSMAHNKLKGLPDGLLFSATVIERLDLSHNLITRVPVSVFSGTSGRSLCELDLSHNAIAAIHPENAISRFQSLTVLDLSHNRLTRFEDHSFANLPRLTRLDLGYNPLEAEPLSRPLASLDTSNKLIELGLAGLGLEAMPSLPIMPSLRELWAQDNLLPTLPSDLAANLTGLRLLDVRDNSLDTLGQVGHGGGLLLPQLRTLRLAGNPFMLVSDACLAMAVRLGDLDLRNLTHLTSMEGGSLTKMSLLRTVRLGTYQSVRDFNIPRMLRYNHALKNLHVEVDSREQDLNEKMNGVLPTKVSSIFVSGYSLKSLSNNVLSGVRSPNLHFALHNTSVESLQQPLFQQLWRVRNLTLDVRNNSLKTLSNPNTALKPNQPRTTFLTGVQLSGNRWKCDCDLGWVETWERKKRQLLCPEDDHVCEYGADDDLRDSHCDNKKNQSLIDVLKADLECGWASSATFLSGGFLSLVSVLLVALITV